MRFELFVKYKLESFFALATSRPSGPAGKHHQVGCMKEAGEPSISGAKRVHTGEFTNCSPCM